MCATDIFLTRGDFCCKPCGYWVWLFVYIFINLMLWHICNDGIYFFCKLKADLKSLIKKNHWHKRTNPLPLRKFLSHPKSIHWPQREPGLSLSHKFLPCRFVRFRLEEPNFSGQRFIHHLCDKSLQKKKSWQYFKLKDKEQTTKAQDVISNEMLDAAHV